MPALEFENQMLNEVVEEDACLVVTSRGVGLEKLLVQLVKAFSEPDNLVVVIGTSVDEEKFILKLLEDEKVASNRMPKSITSEIGTSERKNVYALGGVLFVTSRILVVDMLVGRIPIEEITGLILYDAHKILEQHQEKFILRLFRAKNKTGFIKALTQAAPSFTKGFATVDRIMRSLFVTAIFLWPRFKEEVSASLNARAQPEVIEVRFTLSPLMEAIQFAVIDLISRCLKEMCKANVSFACEAEDLTVEHALSPQFTRFIKRKLEPIWHSLPPNLKRLVGDIHLLRQVLFSLTEDDCVTFYNFVESIRQSVKLDATVSDWLFWKEADTLFDGARQRLDLKNVSPSKKMTFAKSAEEHEFEFNPKWNSFHEIVDEIKKETEGRKVEVNILVLVREEATIRKLKDVIDKGPRLVLNELYYNTKLALNEPLSDDEEPTPSSRRPFGGGKHKRKRPDASLSNLSFTQQLQLFNDHQEASTEKHKDLNINYHSSQDGHLKLEEFLRKRKPKYVIMYDPDMEAIRRLEVYQAIVCSPEKLKVYFFVFDGSAEEQRYMTSLRKEKEAFKFLYREKESLVIPAERDGKCGNHPDLLRESGLVEQDFKHMTAKKKKELSRNQAIDQKIIVDMREFRSELPSLIHKRGIDIEPATIEIGDYVLSPEMCVERKSISDLIQSLNSGRLYTQASVMTRHYKRSILLIEFDGDKPFNLKGKLMGFGYRKNNFITDNSTTMESMPKLILLTLTFPALRVMWSPSPRFTADSFEHLKVNKEQPNMEKVLEASEKQLPVERNPDKYDLQAKEFLLSLPGVHLANVYRIMNRVKSIYDLAKMTIAELIALLESERCGQALHEAMHAKLTTALINNQLKAEKTAKAAKRFRKKT